MSKQECVVKKAVLPVAGLGTRMLPATKAIPKEMLPIVDKPLVQFVVHEAVAAGIHEIVLVTHVGKESISNHFDQSFELEATLEKRVKRQLLAEIQQICPPEVSIIQVHQSETKGLGHAILCAHSVVGDQPFAVLLPDVLIASDKPKLNLGSMLQRFEETRQSQIMVEPIPYSQVNQYGIAHIDASGFNDDSSCQILGVVEKPSRENAPSNLAVVGRYVLSEAIWDLLERIPPDPQGEIQLTDAIAELIHHETVHAYLMHGKSFDCGSKQGYCIAFIEHALRHPEIGHDIKAYLRTHEHSSS